MTAPDSVTALRADIELHRQELADTVDQLADKLDVKARARAKALELKPYAAPAAGVVGLGVVALVVKRKRS
jgi:hypothetical protein